MDLAISKALTDHANEPTEVAVEVVPAEEVEALESAEELAGIVGAPDGHPKGGVHHWAGDPSPELLTRLREYHSKRFALRRAAKGGCLAEQLATPAARSYVGGVPMIPQAELATWPTTSGGAPMDYMVQLARADFPELPWPGDSALVQVFKTPVEEDAADGFPFTEGVHLRWGTEIALSDALSRESLPPTRGYPERGVLQRSGLIKPVALSFEHSSLLDVLPTNSGEYTEAEDLGWMELGDDEEGFTYRVDVRGAGAANLGQPITTENVVLQVGGYPTLWINPPGSYRLTPGSEPMLVLLAVYFDEGMWCILQCPKTGTIRSSFS